MIYDALLYLLYAFHIIICAEYFGYIWHKYAAHSSMLEAVKNTHKIHHMAEIDADEDFVWLLMLLILLEIGLGILVMLNIFPGSMAIITVIVSLLVFSWNWWIHKAYHEENHWLNQYEWFRYDKALHMMHHRYPHTNYSISSHFFDKLLGTLIADPYMYN